MVMPTAGKHSLSQGCVNYHLHGICAVENAMGKGFLCLNSPGAGVDVASNPSCVPDRQY